MILSSQFSVYLNQTGNEPLYASDNSNDSLKKINALMYLLAAGAAAVSTGGGPASSSNVALVVRADRIDWGIQNLGTNVLYVKLGSGASITNYDWVLNASAVAGDGLGGAWTVANWKGDVTVAGTSPSYKAWDI